MKINFLTTQPEFFDSILTSSIIGRAVTDKKVDFRVLCLRDFADGNKKKITDDAPYGGGAGMIMKIEPIYRALQALEEQGRRGQVFLTSASGTIFTQTIAQNLSTAPALTFICGHYEGVDERITHFIDGQLSLGQFVLTGGEPAAATFTDAIVRLLPGVLGNPASLLEESFSDQNLTEYPQYTRPQEFMGHSVPEILLSGNHAAIAKWRQEQRQEQHQNKN